MYSTRTVQNKKEIIRRKTKQKLKQFTLGQCAANKINISSNVLFYRRLRPDLHSASHIHFQVHICITFTKPNNFPVSSQSSIHNFFY